MKNLRKRIAASAAATCLAVSLATPAFAGGSTSPGIGSIVGDSTLQASAITVTVPGNLNFAIDPVQGTGGPSQISNASKYSFENGGAGAALIAVYLDVKTAEGVTLKPNSEMENFAAFSSSTKELSFGAIAATTDDGTTVAWNPDNSEAIVEAENGKIEFGMVMAGSQVNLAGTPGANTGDLNATFSFYSRMNAYADWKAGDVKVEGRYLLAGVNPGTLAGGDALVTNTTGLVAVDLPKLPAVPTVLTASQTTAASTSLEDWVAGTSVLQFKLGTASFPTAITSVTRKDNNYVFAEGTNYSYDKVTGLLSLKTLPAAGTYEFAVVAGTKTYTIALTVTE